jgi:hydroxypyruvate isomerase
MNRRKFLSAMTLAAASAPLLPQSLRAEDAAPPKLKGNLQHSVCRGCFGKVSLDEACRMSKELGLVGIDLLNPSDFATVKKHGLTCTMVSFPVKDDVGSIRKAFNRVEYHDTLVEIYTQRIQETADAGFEQLICFSGSRGGMDDETGLKNCAEGLKKILPLAEKLKVTLCMELLNSKRNHKDYQCDHTAWGVELVKRVGSERFKLLYDIFHMQIMEGDICDTIRENHEHIAHYHTAGVPGRRDIDDSQELNYAAVMRAIVATGYRGVVAQEFTAKAADRMPALRQAIQICDV